MVSTVSGVLLICLLFLKRAYNPQIESRPKALDIKTKLDSTREKILVIISQKERFHDAQIAELAGTTKILATLHLHDLRNEKFVSSTFGLDENSYQVDIWAVEQPGRKYLEYHGLLGKHE